MSSTLAIPFVRAVGGPFERGRRHGAARARALRDFLDDGLCRLDRVLPTAVSMESLGPALAAYASEIAAATPLLADEIHGLAEGARIGLDEALLLQVRREIMGYQRLPAMGECTTYARSGGAPPVLAQTIDLSGDLDDQIGILELGAPGSARRSLVLSFAGQLGYLGLNSDGLAVGLNLVLGGDWRPGLPPYLAIRHLLDTASGVDQALEVLRGLRLASSRSLTLCDRTKTAWVEVLGDERRVVEAAESIHTNHYLDPDLAPHDALNVFARNYSVQRLETGRRRLAALPAAATAEEHLALLSAPPICVEGDGDIRRERTVAAIAMLPDRGELHVRPGNPSRSATQRFALSLHD